MKSRLVVVLALVCIASAPIASIAESSERVVSVKILLDRDNHNREGFLLMGNALNLAVKKFKNEFGIKLVIQDIQSWVPVSDNFSAHEELEKLISKRHSSDLVVAFTAKPFFRSQAVDIDGEPVIVEQKLGGLATLLGNHTIVSLEEKSGLFLIHELGHLMGVDHSGDPDSIMNAEGVKSSDFDKKSAEIILKNRDRKF